MNVTRSVFVLWLLVLLNALPVCAQTTPGQDETVGFAEVRRLRAEIESDPSLREEMTMAWLRASSRRTAAAGTSSRHR